MMDIITKTEILAFQVLGNAGMVKGRDMLP